MRKFYVHHNGHSWFVKTAILFIEQGGLTQPWGKAWDEIEADSVEHARQKAAQRIWTEERKND